MIKTDKFLKAVKVVFANEGGYVDHPLDKGGKTNMGITAATLREANRYHITTITDVRNLTRGVCEDIYYKMYWEPCKAELLLSPLDLIHFDVAVNSGSKTAQKLFQKSINRFLNTNKLVVDGAIGNKTLKEYELIINKDSTNITKLTNIYFTIRKEFYDSIVSKNPSQKVFLKGWYNRLNHLKNIVKKGY